MHRGDRLGVRTALIRRRAGSDVPDAGDTRSDDRHVRRSDHRISPARDIAADAADRDVLVAEHDAGQCLDFDIAHRGALKLGKMADLRLCEFDVLDRFGRHFGNQRLNLTGTQPKARRRPFVETLAEFAHCCIAAFRDVGDDRLDRAADLCVGLFLLSGQRRFFICRGMMFSS
jgi:hypothetical protein